MSQLLGRGIEAIAVGGRDGVSRRQVQPSTVFQRQFPVDRFSHPAVGQVDDRGPGAIGFHQDEMALLERRESPRRFAGRKTERTGEKIDRDRAVEDRQQSENLPLSAGQGCQPALEDPGQARCEPGRLGRGVLCHPCAHAAFQDSFLGERLDELLEVEGVPLGLFQQHPGERFRSLFERDHRG